LLVDAVGLSAHLRFLLIVGDVFGDSGYLFFQLLFLLGLLVLLEGGGVEELLAVAVLAVDEAVGVGTEAHRSAEVVQLHLLPVAHLRKLPLPTQSLALHRGVLHALLVPAVLVLRLVGQQFGPAHLGRLKALPSVPLVLEVS
jgi:hypothetical protein